MLARALLYKDILNKKIVEQWDNLANKYYFIEYCTEVEVQEDSWKRDQFVSLDEDYNVIGFMSARHVRSADRVDSICLIALSSELRDRTTVLVDIQKLIHDYFYKYNKNSVEFGVYIGNPVEKFYDKYVESVGGKVCSYFRQCDKAVDGTLLDYKGYEIMASEYKAHVPADCYNKRNKEAEKLAATFAKDLK